MPFGGIRIVEQSCKAYGREVDPEVDEIFHKYRKTHNDGVFSVYTPDIRAARSNHLITGLPDGYGRGRIIGDYRRVALYGVNALIDEKKVRDAEEYFRKHGAASTFFGRLIPGIRQLISIPAGLANMKMGPFLLYTTLGAGAWNIVLALLGYFIYKFTDLKTTNDVYELATKYSHEIGYVILILAVFVVGFIIYKGLKKNKPETNN